MKWASLPKAAVGWCSFILCSLKTVGSLGSVQNTISLVENFVTFRSLFYSRALAANFSLHQIHCDQIIEIHWKSFELQKDLVGFELLPSYFKPLSAVKLALEALQKCCINFSLKFLWLVVQRVQKMKRYFPYRCCSKTERAYEKKVHMNILVGTVQKNRKK